MFAQLFQSKKKGQVPTDQLLLSSQEPRNIKPKTSLSRQEQKEKHKQRRKSIINEFGKSVINFLQDHEIWTPLHIVDFLEVKLPRGCDIQDHIINAIKHSHALHKENLREKPYQKSFNFQPSYLLIVVKDHHNNTITSFKNEAQNLEKLVNILKPEKHKLFLVRYFIPPIPDDLYKYDGISLPPKFQEAVDNIINYVDVNFSTDNLPFTKWKSMIEDLHDFGIRLNLPHKTEEIALNQLLVTDYSEIGYDQLSVKQIVKETVEKNPIAIPSFILLLALLCSDENAYAVFPYHYLFCATGSGKERTMSRGEISFPKLFNQLLDESLKVDQFNKCLFLIYNEAFRFKQAEIDDLLLHFRERTYHENSK